VGRSHWRQHDRKGCGRPNATEELGEGGGAGVLLEVLRSEGVIEHLPTLTKFARCVESALLVRRLVADYSEKHSRARASDHRRTAEQLRPGHPPRVPTGIYIIGNEGIASAAKRRPR
jgi:hypothetical protein